MFILVFTSALKPRPRSASDRLRELTRYKTATGMIILAVRKCERCKDLFWGKRGYAIPKRPMKHICPRCHHSGMSHPLPPYVRMLSREEITLIKQHHEESGCTITNIKSTMVT